MTGKIYFIYNPSPTIGRSPITSAGSGLFGLYKPNQYVAVLQRKLQCTGVDWRVELDDTAADIEKLIHKNATLLICAPGLRYQFYINGFDKKNIVYLSMFDYVTNNATSVIKRVKEISNEHVQ